ncbi:MAG: sensor domain-containing diguanylate cyclase [Methylomonas lenta]|nr:sensor domain-containing diguanylate cyclase [Methylomonas lenta]
MNQQMKFDIGKEWAGTGVQDLIVDLVNALSAVKSLSEVNCEMADEKTVIRYALAALLQNQDMERCSFFVIDNNGILSNVTGLSTLDSPEDNMWLPEKSMSFQLGEGIIGAAAASGKVQQCNNCQENQQFANTGNPSSVPGSIICVPVYTLRKVLIGVLNVSHPQPGFFSNWHLRLLEVYANILGQLITNRRLFQQMESQISLRTAELERLVQETSQLKDYYASMSMHDQLTGLHNRRYFYEQVGLALAHHKRYAYPFCLLVMDIDYFKAINDKYGHQFGDEVLISVSEALKKEVRNTDILVRFGGEEFVIIFTNIGCDSGKQFSERIREQIKALSWSNGEEKVSITISIGLHCLNPKYSEVEPQLDIDQIISCADAALYAAKDNGRDRVEVFGAFLSNT